MIAAVARDGSRVPFLQARARAPALLPTVLPLGGRAILTADTHRAGSVPSDRTGAREDRSEACSASSDRSTIGEREPDAFCEAESLSYRTITLPSWTITVQPPQNRQTRLWTPIGP